VSSPISEKYGNLQFLVSDKDETWELLQHPPPRQKKIGLQTMPFFRPPTWRCSAIFYPPSSAQSHPCDRFFSRSAAHDKASGFVIGVIGGVIGDIVCGKTHFCVVYVRLISSCRHNGLRQRVRLLYMWRIPLQPQRPVRFRPKLMVFRPKL